MMKLKEYVHKNECKSIVVEIFACICIVGLLSLSACILAEGR